MSITLEAITAEHARIAEMIEQFKRQPTPPAFPITVQFPALAKGEKFIGVIISADGSRRHALILLPGEKTDIKWEQAMDWAKSIGGELPDRCEGALLFATMKDEFKPEWYWTRAQHAAYSGCAWHQTFYYGYQYYDRKSAEGRARAVRRLEIQ